MIPQTLSDWSIDLIKELLQKGYFESEKFDFKEMLPSKGDQNGKHRITEACSAFANSTGGFLVFGIKDDKSLSIEDRLVGLDSSIDFPEHFGNYPQACIPSVDWTFLNPPLKTDKGREIHIVQIFKSFQAPHCVKNKGKGFIYAKRTNKGVEEMSYEEIKGSYLGYYEKHIKLQLLLSELHDIRDDAYEIINIEEEELDNRIKAITFDGNVMQSVLNDTFSLLKDQHELLRLFGLIRNHCRHINNRCSMIFPIMYVPMVNKEEMILAHNESLKLNCPSLIKHTERAISILTDFLDKPQ